MPPPHPAPPRGFLLPVFVLLGLSVCPALPAATVSVPPLEEIAARFQPLRIPQAVLSPDGRRIAFVRREGAELALVIAEVDKPDNRTVVSIGEDDTRDILQRGTTTPVRLKSLLWATPDRLVYSVSLPSSERNGEQIRAIDADGRNPRLLTDGATLNGLPVLLGLRLKEPNTVAVEAIGERYVPRADEGNLRVKRIQADGQPGASLIDDLRQMHNENRVRLSQMNLTDSGEPLLPSTAPAEIVDPPPEANDPRPPFSTLYRVDLATGKAQALRSEATDGKYLYDQQALVRVMSTAPYSIRAPSDPTANSRAAAANLGDGGSNGRVVDVSMIDFAETKVFTPQRYRYRPEKSWQDLDTFLGKEKALAFVTSPETHYKPRSFPLAFDADPKILYFASNVGRDTFGLYALDLATKQRLALIEDPAFDVVQPEDGFNAPVLVFDRFQKLAGVRLPGIRARTRWIDANLARIQTAIEARFPRRDVALESWDDTRKRVVARVSTPADPGRLYVYDEGTPANVRELVRRGAPFAGELNDTRLFTFETPAGVRLTGLLALPAQPRLDPAPLVVLCRDIPGPRPSGEYDPEVQALADLGFAVATVYYRGSAGLGTQHRDAVRAGFDTVPVEDVRATIAWLVANHPLNAKRIALVGHDYGGYVALRAAQLYPDQFRAVVAINAPMTPLEWSDGTYDAAVTPDYDIKVRQAFFDRALAKRVSHPAFAESVATPAFVVQDEQKRDLRMSQGKALYDGLKRRGIATEYLAAPLGFTAGEPNASASVFAKVAGFLNDHIYDYNVDIGVLKEVK